MRTFFKVATLLFMFIPVGSAYADICKVELTRHNYLVRTFTGWGYDRREACREGLRECHREMRNMSRGHNPDPSLECTTRRRGNPRQGNSCVYTLRNYYGHILESFESRRGDFRSCQRTENRCERASRRYSGTTYCQKENRRGRPPQRGGVTQSCSVERVSRTNRHIQTHRATARGRRRSQVKQRACRKALEQCQRSSRIGEKCRKRR